MEEWQVLHFFVNKIFAKCKKKMTDCQGRERTGLVYIYFHWEVSSLSAGTLQAMETKFPKLFVLMPLPFFPKQLNVLLQ